jgi:hypothetical protein
VCEFLIQCKKVQLSGKNAQLQISQTGIENQVFQGASSLSLDAKGRLSVPTRHREVLSATAVANSPSPNTLMVA